MTRELTLPDDCAWCGAQIDDYDDAMMIIEGRPHRDVNVVAVFHEGTCYGEAASYGWS